MSLWAFRGGKLKTRFFCPLRSAQNDRPWLLLVILCETKDLGFLCALRVLCGEKSPRPLCKGIYQVVLRQAQHDIRGRIPPVPFTRGRKLAPALRRLFRPYHILRLDFLVEFFSGEEVQGDGGFFECAVILESFLRDFRCVVVADVRVECGDQHQ